MRAWKYKTNKGRVVYDRKPTPFTCKDVRRIAGRVFEEYSEFESQEDFYCILAIVDTVVPRAIEGAEFWVERIESLGNFLYGQLEVLAERGVAFGGGEFAGAGATRDAEEEE